MHEHRRSTLILYPAAVCNLSCTYCYIDKNSALKKIDKILEESFETDYYIEFARRMIPTKEQLRKIEFWGGEPTLGLMRTFSTLKGLIEEYPNLRTFFFSTNFVSPVWDEAVFGLFELLKSYSNRPFEVSIQLSLDGPEYITDMQRGKGVSKKFWNHFCDVCSKLKECLENSNVRLNMYFKATLTDELIQKYLLTRDGVLDYYRCFERYMDKYIEIMGEKPLEKISFSVTVPNTAEPSPHTQEDGKNFARFCEITTSIEKEIQTNPPENRPLKYYNCITPFKKRGISHDYNRKTYKGINGDIGACGAGMSQVGLLPNGYISCCHGAFTELISDYKREVMQSGDIHSIDFKVFMDSSNYLICKEDKYEEFEKKVLFAYDPEETAQLANIASLIKLIAEAGQIDEEYKTPEGAMVGALFYKRHLPYCFRDNIATTGTCACVNTGIIRELLNGARGHIENGEE